ncbi:hypothetical protein D3C76_1233240 [compost metagenome]
MNSVSAIAAAIHGEISSPARATPKNTRNSCINSGVPWNSSMYVRAKLRGRDLSEMRMTMISKPISPPPMNATSDSASVHCRPMSRLRTMSQKVKSLIGCSLQ